LHCYPAAYCCAGAVAHASSVHCLIIALLPCCLWRGGASPIIIALLPSCLCLMFWCAVLHHVKRHHLNSVRWRNSCSSPPRVADSYELQPPLVSDMRHGCVTSFAPLTPRYPLRWYEASAQRCKRKTAVAWPMHSCVKPALAYVAMPSAHILLLLQQAQQGKSAPALIMSAL
jgi:hypothetical protein